MQSQVVTIVWWKEHKKLSIDNVIVLFALSIYPINLMQAARVAKLINIAITALANNNGKPYKVMLS